MIVTMNHSDVLLSTTASSGLITKFVRHNRVATANFSLSESIESSKASTFLSLDNITRLSAALNSSANSSANSTSSDHDFTDFVRTAPGHADIQLLLERFSRNRSIDGLCYYVLIIMYSVLILFGALGNTLVVIAVVRKPVMRTARNLFILNLAVSDLLLCLITMPLTLMEILSKYWPFGTCAILCKLVAMLQATSIFVSTISITAIATDRYQVIVYPTHDNLQFLSALTILFGIWLLAVLLASPMFIFKRLIHADIPSVLQSFGIRGVSFCIEDWPLNHGRFYYSIFSLCVQYLLPIVIVSGAYFGIYNKLKHRITVVNTTTAMTSVPQAHRKAERGRRMKRTNCLLISIAMIFGISWLPLNFYNLYADMQRAAVTQHLLVAYAICHMIGMSSACSNPLLYGWLNDNFRKEFHELLCCFKVSSNQAFDKQPTGGGQTRRRRKDVDISKGDLKLLVNGGGGGGGVFGAKGCGGNSTGCGSGTSAGAATTSNGGVRSAVTESVMLTENPMALAVFSR